MVGGRLCGVEALAMVEAMAEASVGALAWEEASVGALAWEEASVEALVWEEALAWEEASADGGLCLMPVTVGRSLPPEDMVIPTTPRIVNRAGIRFSGWGALCPRSGGS
jgi:hypothetical protein